MKKLVPLILIVFPILFLLLIFRPWWQNGQLPIPADTIVGLYHPWRDAVANQYPNGIPFKNYLVTDSVRQQYPWRYLAIESLKKGELPLWNPYSLGGAPLLANFQAATFYPLNLLYFPFSFNYAWSLQIVLEPVLGIIFMFLYLSSGLKLKKEAAVFGSLCWAGSGFFTAWLTQNTLVQTILWLPLILLALEKTFSSRKYFLWVIVFVFSLACSFLAGAAQIFAIYCLPLTLVYGLWRYWSEKNSKRLRALVAALVLFLLVVSPILVTYLRNLPETVRAIDPNSWQKPGWFIPWQNLIQFLAPDYFGNPATLNYTGVWNYMEFVGYIGIAGLFLSFGNFFTKKNGYDKFFLIILVVSLTFASSNFLAQVPYMLHIPFISLAQPTRLLALIDFSLAILAAFGLHKLLENQISRPKIIGVGLFLLTLCLAGLVIAVVNHWPVAEKNLLLPTFLVLATSLVLSLFASARKNFVLVFLLTLTVIDLARFMTKFEPFSDPQLLYPETKITAFLHERTNNQIFRVTSLDDRIFPANFNDYYHFQFAGGYDSLFPQRYSELAAAIENANSQKTTPGQFNRILSVKNYRQKLFPLLNVKYLLSFYPLDPNRYVLVSADGQTKLYEDTLALPRAYFISRIIPALNREDALTKMFSLDFNPRQMAVVENYSGAQQFFAGTAALNSYSASEINITTVSPGNSFLVISDNYSPLWTATVDSRPTKIYLTNYAFRGIIIPEGRHQVILQTKFW